jgi:hypothetical protein
VRPTLHHLIAHIKPPAGAATAAVLTQYNRNAASALR